MNSVAFANTIEFKYASNSDPLYNTLSEKIWKDSAKIAGLGESVKPLFLGAYCNQRLIGGIAAFEFYGSLMIDILWIEPEFRKQGIGSQLLQKVEAVARDKKLKFITVSTMDFWKADHFYKKHGFQLEGKRDGYVNNFTQLHFIKMLEGTGDGKS